MLWPPPRMETSKSFFLAKSTACITSAAPVHRAMSAGRLSIMAFQIVRPLSYPGESDVRSSPRMFPFSSLTAVSVISNLPLEVTTCKFRILDEGGFSHDKTVSDNSQIAMRILAYVDSKRQELPIDRLAQGSGS